MTSGALIDSMPPMPLLKPILPPYDIGEWQKKPFPERVKMVCQSWALQGYGTPTPIYVVYILKIFFYIWVWSLFCSFTPGLGELGSLKGDAAHHAAQWQGEALPLSEALVEDSDLIVDALFGAGLSRPLEGACRVVVEAINARELPVVAVDVPSGVSGDRFAGTGRAGFESCLRWCGKR